MLIIDPNDAPFLPSACLDLPHCVLPGLEDATGVDIVLSTWQAPISTPTLQWQHVKRGVGYQLKRGTDLIHSIQDGRIMSQLTRMQGYWEDGEWWLVHIADVGALPHTPSDVSMDGGMTDFSYISYLSAIRNWQRAGGLWLTLSPNYPFERWVQDELIRMERDQDSRLIRKPFTRLLPLTPQEETLATFPLLGPTRAHALWMELAKVNAAQNLTQALVWLSDGFAERVEGIGKGVTRAVREHLGLKEEENLAIAFNGDWPELQKGERE